MNFWLLVNPIYSNITVFLDLSKNCQNKTQVTIKWNYSLRSCPQCYSPHSLKYTVKFPSQPWNIKTSQGIRLCSLPVGIQETEVDCDFEYQLKLALQEALIPDDWVRSHDHFHFAHFGSDFNDLWDSLWGWGMQQRLHQHLWVLRIDNGCKMGRWRVFTLPWGQVSKRDRDRNRQKAERHRDSERERVKEREEEARACQDAGYGSKSRQVKSTQPKETQERDSDCQFEYQPVSPPWIKAMIADFWAVSFI